MDTHVTKNVLESGKKIAKKSTKRTKVKKSTQTDIQPKRTSKTKTDSQVKTNEDKVKRIDVQASRNENRKMGEHTTRAIGEQSINSRTTGEHSINSRTQGEPSINSRAIGERSIDDTADIASVDYTQSPSIIEEKYIVDDNLTKHHGPISTIYAEDLETNSPILTEFVKTDSLDKESSENIEGYLDLIASSSDAVPRELYVAPPPPVFKSKEPAQRYKVKSKPKEKLPETPVPLISEVMTHSMELMKEELPLLLKSQGKNMKRLRRVLRQRAMDKEKARLEEKYTDELQSFVDACIHAGMLRKAHSVVTGNYINFKGGKTSQRKASNRPLRAHSIYTSLIKAWAKKGNLDRLRKLLEQMLSLQVEASLADWVACLECVGRQTVFDVQIAQLIVDDIKKAGYTPESIPTRVAMTQSQWKYVLKTLKQVDPSYTPEITAFEKGYTCNLLTNDTKKVVDNPFHGVLDSDKLQERIDRQLEIELHNDVTVPSIQPAAVMTETLKTAREKLKLCEAGWKSTLTDSFNTLVKYEEMKSQGENVQNLLPYLKLFPVDTYVTFMLQEISNIGEQMSRYSPDMRVLHLKLGTKLFTKLIIQHRIATKHPEKVKGLYQEYVKLYAAKKTSSNPREIWQSILEKHEQQAFLVPPFRKWPYHILKQVGSLLYGIIMADARIDVNIFKDNQPRHEVPAFHTVYRYRNVEMHEEVMPHPMVVRVYEEAQIRELTFEAREMPSLVPPMPWAAVHAGGNLLSTAADLVRFSFAVKQQVQKLEALPPQQLYPVYDALNAVSATPWRINTQVLDVIIEMFNCGGNTHLDVPTPITDLPQPPKIDSSMPPKQKMQAIYERVKLMKKKKEMFGLWCTELYRLSIANKFRDDVFWFPHNLDFRGRMYTIPPHFSHLGSDLARSILMFAKGKPLGEHGLDWMKIHLINLTGFKKRSSNAERLLYANEIMPQILDSADNPLTGSRWWMTSDEPWQTLACSKEIAAATRSVDGPERYVSHVPVQQDGSCNGLQHYAALGRDSAGAQSVNLTPSMKPNDVYSDVVELVEAERIKDAADGNYLAQILEGYIKRKVIKQTIMTTVYGVTQYGARQQIRGQLQDIISFPQQHTRDAAFYLADKTFLSLQKVFTSTKEIQDWLIVCAELISRLCLSPVVWQTPLGFPVLQPYWRHSRMKLTATELKSIQSWSLKRIMQIEKPNALKQKNALPPNFIHSLDATHMMLTAIYCLRAGVTFVSVHDCFWTHASDVATMNKICREQFVSLHDEPILEDLSASLLKAYATSESTGKGSPDIYQLLHHVLAKVPKTGSFELEQVLDSDYFFS